MSQGYEKRNCWEAKHCGREPGGRKTHELGVCPASNEMSLDSINSGKCAGRFCWAVAGTFSGEEVQGTFAAGRHSCIDCEFFKEVQKEEGIAKQNRKFLKFINQDSSSAILDVMTCRYVKAGERFIAQGEEGDNAYIIRRGSCLVTVEKEGELHPVNHLGAGDIVGEMALLTGETRRAHVEALTDLDLWVLDKEQFGKLSKQDAEIMDFLTELVAGRFDSTRPIADREIGRYAATDIIGRGAFSIVYKGLHKGLNMPVVIKMMRHNMAMNPEFLESFRNEARIIARLNHKNIVRVYDIEELLGTVFIVMEYLDGVSLKQLLTRLQSMPTSLAAELLVQICSGLGYAHQQGMIHRDIKPGNIFILPGDAVKILDFGLACPSGTEDFESLGTIFYMAPEQIEGDPLDTRTDIYALGILAYEMVTGKRPFPEESLGKLSKLHCTENIPDPAEAVPDLPDAMRRFVTKAGRCNPEERFQDVEEMMDVLRPLTGRWGLDRRARDFENWHMSALCLIYKEESQADLNRLIEEFGDRAEKLGINMKATNFQNIFKPGVSTPEGE